MPLREDNILEGSLVRLAALTEDDAVHLVRFQRNAAYSRLLDTWPARPRSKDEIVKRIKDEAKRDTVYHFSIRRMDDDEFLGFAELDGIDWSHGSCELGIGLGNPDNWGKGYGRDAMKLLLTFAFSEMNLHRVGLTVFAYNERARALYEKMGFVHEGTQRERLHRDGERYDMLDYGILRREWEASIS